MTLREFSLLRGDSKIFIDSGRFCFIDGLGAIYLTYLLNRLWYELFREIRRRGSSKIGESRWNTS
jgi:hypothetical protein